MSRIINVVLQVRSSISKHDVAEFLEYVVQNFPHKHKIHTILTDNGSEFTDIFIADYRTKDGNIAKIAKPFGAHFFAKTCQKKLY